MPGTPACPDPKQRDSEITILVEQALDDLDGERLDVASALRLIAQLAWDSGYRANENHTSS